MEQDVWNSEAALWPLALPIVGNGAAEELILPEAAEKVEGVCLQYLMRPAGNIKQSLAQGIQKLRGHIVVLIFKIVIFPDVNNIVQRLIVWLLMATYSLFVECLIVRHFRQPLSGMF